MELGLTHNKTANTKSSNKHILLQTCRKAAPTATSARFHQQPEQESTANTFTGEHEM
jgi:hypothetical protein